MATLMREAPIGRLIRLLTRDRYLKYPEEELDFVLPERYLSLLEKPLSSPTSNSVFTNSTEDAAGDSTVSNAPTVVPETQSPEVRSLTGTIEQLEDSIAVDLERQLDKHEADLTLPKQNPDGIILVDWYDPMDPANPQNWTGGKKACAALIISLYTFAVYTGSAIYISSEPSVSLVFGVSEQVAALPLSLYVLSCMSLPPFL